VLPVPIRVDDEVAAARFKEHLAWLNSPRAAELGLTLIKQERLHAIVKMSGSRADGQQDEYYLRLGADFYDKWPPTAGFVKPETWDLAACGTRWLPKIQCQGVNWFGLHAPYNSNGLHLPQLLCFTFTAEYYMVPHSPPPDSVWRQGYHTLSATLSRLCEVLKHPHYQGPSGQ